MVEKYIQKLINSIGILTGVTIIALWVIWQDYIFVSSFMEENQKPLATFILLLMAVMHETTVVTLKKSDRKIDALSKQLKVQSLKDAVNSMYGRYQTSGSEWIVNDSEIKELAELTDLREKYDVNSYTQDRLEYLNSKVKRK